MDAGERDSRLRVADLVAAFSLATDLGLDQPVEHVLRSWLVAAQLGERADRPGRPRTHATQASVVPPVEGRSSSLPASTCNGTCWPTWRPVPQSAPTCAPCFAMVKRNDQRFFASVTRCSTSAFSRRQFGREFNERDIYANFSEDRH